MIAKGARVRLNEAGRAVVSRERERIGTVTGLSNDRRAAWVLWDGGRTTAPWLFEYLVPVESPLTAPPPPV